MTTTAEDSLSPRPPSNEVVVRALAALARACDEATRAATIGQALHAILLAAVETIGAERGYLVTLGPGREDLPGVRVAVSLRPDGMSVPSATALRWALVESKPVLCPDPQIDPRLCSGASIRGLALRYVSAAPVPAQDIGSAALVVDSRIDPRLRHSEVPSVLEAFAGIVGILLSAPQRKGAGKSTPTGRPLGSQLVGHSPPFLELERAISRVADTKLPVLIVGESGVGKEAVARALHALSARSAGPLLAINCAAFPETLLESELFGATRGAYTGADRDRPGLFQLAHGGTLFLDEVGDMPLPMQAKLLRVVQDGRIRPVGGTAEVGVDVRIVAATHRDLLSLVPERLFRADLYYRLAVVQLRVPALRERREDIPALVDHLLSLLESEMGLPRARPTPATMERLRSYAWPGNVRELESVLARAVLRARTADITPIDLDLLPGPCEREPSEPQGLERRMLESALRESGGNLTRAADRIGWSRQKLSRRMAALGVARPF